MSRCLSVLGLLTLGLLLVADRGAAAKPPDLPANPEVVCGVKPQPAKVSPSVLLNIHPILAFLPEEQTFLFGCEQQIMPVCHEETKPASSCPSAPAACAVKKHLHDLKRADRKVHHARRLARSGQLFAALESLEAARRTCPGPCIDRQIDEVLEEMVASLTASVSGEESECSPVVEEAPLFDCKFPGCCLDGMLAVHQFGMCGIDAAMSYLCQLSSKPKPSRKARGCGGPHCVPGCLDPEEWPGSEGASEEAPEGPCGAKPAPACTKSPCHEEQEDTCHVKPLVCIDLCPCPEAKVKACCHSAEACCGSKSCNKMCCKGECVTSGCASSPCCGLSARLKAPVSVNFMGVPLHLVFEQIHSAYGIELAIDGSALAAAGVPVMAPVTLQAQYTPLHAVLETLVHPMGLRLVVRGDAVCVTGPSKPCTGVAVNSDCGLTGSVCLNGHKKPCAPDGAEAACESGPTCCSKKMFVPMEDPCGFKPVKAHVEVRMAVKEQVDCLLQACYQAVADKRFEKARELARRAHALDTERTEGDPIVYKMHLLLDETWSVAPEDERPAPITLIKWVGDDGLERWGVDFSTGKPGPLWPVPQP